MDRLSEFIIPLIEPQITTLPNLSLSIGIIHDSHTQTVHFGATHPPSDRSLYEIGSITKVFTALLLARLVQDGQVNLSDSVTQHLPDLPHFPAAITLLSLTTHTSGLPRLPRNLWWSALKSPTNPYAHYRTQDLYAFLKRYRGTKRLGQFEYSNLGVGLLGHILETVTHTPYTQLIAQSITQPLGLTDTVIQLSPDQQQRLIPGYLPTPRPNPKTKPTANWDLLALAGAGALRSSLADLLQFAAANLSAEASPEASPAALTSALAHCHTQQQFIHPSRPADADLGESMMGIGLGWFIRHSKSTEHDTPYPPIHWHDGGTGGYQSYLAFCKPHGVAVVVLANCAIAPPGKGFSADNVGEKLMQTLLSL